MQTLRVTIDSLVHAKIMHWVREAGEFEVSGMGRVLRLDNHLHVLSAFLLPQRNTTSHTELDDEAVSRAMFHTKDEPGDFNFWWHSHGYGNVFFSRTDTDTIRKLGGNGWLIATVFNVHGDHRSSLYVSQPFGHFFDDIATSVLQPLGKDESRALTHDYRAMVTNLRYRRRRGSRTTEYEVVPHKGSDDEDLKNVWRPALAPGMGVSIDDESSCEDSDGNDT